MTDIPLRPLDQTALPPGRTGAVKPPLSLADRSGKIRAAQAGAKFAGDIFDKLVATKAANEDAAFEGAVAAEMEGFETFVKSRPRASFEELESERNKMITRIEKAGQQATTKQSKQRAQQWMLRNKSQLYEKTQTAMVAIRANQELATSESHIKQLENNFDIEGLRNHYELMIQSGLYNREVIFGADGKGGRFANQKEIMENAEAKHDLMQAKETVTAGFQAIIDNGGTKQEALDVIDEASREGIIPATLKGTLSNNLDSYIAGRVKIEKETKSQKTQDAYKTLSDRLLSGGLSLDEITDSGLPVRDIADMQAAMRGSREPEPGLTGKRRIKTTGQDKLYKIVFEHSADSTLGTADAMKELNKLRYVIKTINNDQYKWGVDRIVNNPYPPELVPAIKSMVKSQGVDWGGLSTTEKQVMKRNRDFTDSVDKLLKDESFLSRPLYEKSKIIKREMASLKADVIPPDPNVVQTVPAIGDERPEITVIAPDGTLATIYADELQAAINEGARVAP